MKPDRAGLLPLVAIACTLALAAAGQCPVESCAAGASLLQVGSKSAAVPEGETPCKEVSKYHVDFLPGHFVCTRCDAGACPDCGLLCDLASCVGEFYSQECMCEKGLGAEGVVAFCNEHCGGGLCDAKGQICRPKEAACQPWWWCGSSPPMLLQRQHSSRLLLASGSSEGRARLQQQQQQQRDQERARQLHMKRAAVTAATRRLHSARAQALQGSNLSLALPPEVPNLNFVRSRYDCSSGALPPKTRDPVTFLWVERGYLVLDARSCEGSVFNEVCFCWDNVLRLRGKDPRTSEMKCDKGCMWGACEGRTCSRSPPPAVGSVAVRRHPALFTRVDTTMDVVMEALE